MLRAIIRNSLNNVHISKGTLLSSNVAWSGNEDIDILFNKVRHQIGWDVYAESYRNLVKAVKRRILTTASTIEIPAFKV